MAVVLFVVAAMLAPLVVVGLAAAAGPGWLLWTALLFAVLLVFSTAAEEWWRGKPPPLGWVVVPLALLLLPMCAESIVVRGAAHWVLWPIILVAALALIVRFTAESPSEARGRGYSRGGWGRSPHRGERADPPR